MNKNNNFIDTIESSLENSLRFVKNEFEDDLKTMLENPSKEPDLSHLPFKIIQPEPGFCIKTFELIDDEKLFINICKSDGIPPPENITTEQLTTILNADNNNSYKVPMSITEIRRTKDKSNKLARVCDIAINPRFYERIERIQLFREFFFTIIVEAMETKYNIKVDQTKWIVLKNRSCVGSLVSHKVQNRDVRKVLESYQHPGDDDKKLLEELNGGRKKNLIEEIGIVKSLIKTPQYRLVLSTTKATNNVIAEFRLPGVISDREIILDVGEDRIILVCPKRGYSLDRFFDYKIDQSKSVAQFDENSTILTVTMPVST